MVKLGKSRFGNHTHTPRVITWKKYDSVKMSEMQKLREKLNSLSTILLKYVIFKYEMLPNINFGNKLQIGMIFLKFNVN